MKLLWLGTSNDAEDHIPEPLRVPHLVAGGLREALGAEVEVFVYFTWPTPALPSLVERWMERHEPDMVLLKAPAFWCCYESVPLRIERRLGRLGRPIARAGYRAAGTRWLGSTPLFHFTRGVALKTIGGDYFFEPEEIVERVAACLRVVLRHEDVAVLVRGMSGLASHHGDRRGLPRRQARRDLAHRGLETLCRELKVTYLGLDDRPRGYEYENRLGDRVHHDPEEHEADARELLPLFLEAWGKLHPADGEAPRSSGGPRPGQSF